MKTTISKQTFRQIWLSTEPCRHRRGAVATGRSRTVLDDSGTLAITAWTCADCGELVEEVHILSHDGKSESCPVRYTVSVPMTRQLAAAGR